MHKLNSTNSSYFIIINNTDIFVNSFLPHRRRRRAAAVKNAGTGLTMRYFRFRVLYLEGKGE